MASVGEGDLEFDVSRIAFSGMLGMREELRLSCCEAWGAGIVLGGNESIFMV